MMNTIPDIPLRNNWVEGGCNYRLVHTPTGIIFCRNLDNTVGGVCMFLLGISILLFAPHILARWRTELPPVIGIAFGAIFAFGGFVLLLVDFFVRRYARSYEFNVKQRQLRIRRRDAIVSTRCLKGVTALQMAFAYYHSSHTFWSYELNLVETQDDRTVRTNLFASNRRQGIEALGRDLSDFLHVPLLDHATKQHRLAEKRRQKSNGRHATSLPASSKVRPHASVRPSR